MMLCDSTKPLPTCSSSIAAAAFAHAADQDDSALLPPLPSSPRSVLNGSLRGTEPVPSSPLPGASSSIVGSARDSPAEGVGPSAAASAQDVTVHLAAIASTDAAASTATLAIVKAAALRRAALRPVGRGR